MALAAALAKKTDASSSASLLLCSAKASSPALPPEPAPAQPSSGSGYKAPPAAQAKAAASQPTSVVANVADGLSSNYCIILTQVLPDGLGDLIFGENAVLELQDLGAVAWIRCYSGENAASGERLIQETASTCAFSLACTTREAFGEALIRGGLHQAWAGARGRFLAPWIFGLSQHEEALLGLAAKTKLGFWALTEYGRSMGNIHTYTNGYGSKIPTGWAPSDVVRPCGVFRTIRRAPSTDTNWRQVFAAHCGITDQKVRLWWFYNRGDDEKKHDIRFLEEEKDASSKPHIRAASKLIPVGPDGSIVVTYEKTSGEKLAEQLFQAANDPNFKPTTDVSCVEVESAGQLSQFLWSVIFNETFVAKDAAEAVDIIVTPNLLTSWRGTSGSSCVAANIQRLGLMRNGSTKEVQLQDLGRKVFLCSSRVPRGEMRTFLEQCEEHVFTTGDQSLAEALFLGKDVPVQPDAKVQQWQIARALRVSRGVDSVPDLGEEMRRLVTDEATQERARLFSKLESDETERSISSQVGGGPATWNPTHQILAKAGMLG